jgi:hypothetical protein
MCDQLKNHTKEIWACDFTVVHDLFFCPIYIFVIIELQTRRIVHTAVTHSPSDEWTRQQLREATPWDEKPKYLIRDRDTKYRWLFSRLAQNSGIKELKTPYKRREPMRPSTSGKIMARPILHGLHPTYSRTLISSNIFTKSFTS